ncbi:MAG: AMP-binding protein, partial [Betaproteobacteria bacterium]|nr:AMP-binding protein [Betaproteobacteria bacterium]
MHTTFSQLLARHAQQRPDAPALREKQFGIWQTLSWRDTLELTLALAGGLAALGFRRGEHLAIIGENRPQLYCAMLAAQSLGGVAVPLYQDATAREYAFPLRNADVRFAVVEDQEQVDKLLEIRAECPQLAHVVYTDERGLRKYDEPGLQFIDTLIADGRAWNTAHPGAVQAEIDRGRPDDEAAMFFTSGTTGQPKGVVHTHHSLIERSAAGTAFDHLTPDEDVLAYMPPAWIGQNIFSYAQWLVTGYTVNCPESPATVMMDMKEIGPTYYFAPPRVFEGLLTQVTIRMEDASWLKRKLYGAFMAVARRVGPARMDGQAVGLLDRALYALGNVLVYAPLRNALGMNRIRVAYTAGEAIGPDLFTFYRSLGINLKQLYGSTETAVFVCMQPDGQVKADTVGPPIPGVEIRLADSGEVLVKSPGLLKEYYKNPQATAEVKTADGWYHTGDAGFIDRDGHLKIIDRAKDVGRTAAGALFAPKYIENKLKFFPYIKEAVAIGDGRAEVCAFINIDFDAVGNWAERRNLPYAGYADLAAKPAVIELVRDCVEKVNADLARDDKLAGSQIHRFLVLHKELDPDDDELTRTRKVRRGFIAEKYAPLVAALYGGERSVHVEAQVRYEDGRTGTVKADLKIRDAKTF